MKLDDLLIKNNRKTFQTFEIQIIKIVFEKNICFIVCTLINIDIITKKNFKVDYIIVQKTIRAKNKNVHIIMI